MDISNIKNNAQCSSYHKKKHNIVILEFMSTNIQTVLRAFCLKKVKNKIATTPGSHINK